MAPHPIRISRASAVLVLSLFFLAAAVQAKDTRPPTEHEVKAACLYNFGLFVEWPPEAMRGDTFVIAVLGKDPLDETLDRVLSGEKTGPRRLVVLHIARVEDAGRAQILFVGRSEEALLPGVLKVLENSPVLTVSDIEGFAERGGMIGFRVEDRRVKFDVHLERVLGSGLKASSQLLKLARIVPARGPR